MKLARTVLLLSATAIFTMIATAQNPQVDWARGTDFSALHNFTWATGAYPIQDADVNLGMERAVREGLESKGLRFVPSQEKFDTFVTYNLMINPDPQKPSQKIATIKVRIFTSRDNTVVWQAGGFFVLVPNDRDKNRATVRSMLDQMFAKFPPS